MLLPALLSWLAGVAGGCSALSGALAPLLGCAAGVALPGSALTGGASSTFMGSAPSSVLTAAGACPLSTTVQPAAQHPNIMLDDCCKRPSALNHGAVCRTGSAHHGGGQGCKRQGKGARGQVAQHNLHSVSLLLALHLWGG